MAAGNSIDHKVRVVFEAVMGNLQQQVRQNVNQIRTFGTAGQQAGQRASNGIREAGEASQETRDDLQQLVDQLRHVGNAAENMAHKINLALKGLLTGFVAKQIIGFGVSAVNEYGKTQKALGEMASLGYEDLERLRQSAVDFSNVWSGTTRDSFISSAYDIKSGIASLSDEGVAQFTEMAGLTAKATKASIDEMTSLFATGYGIYRKLYESDFDFGENFAAGISKSVQQFKTKGSEMASYLSTLGSSAAQAGAELDEVLTIGGTLQATMSGSEAATKYNSFLKNAVKAAKALGLSFTDANNQLLSTADIIQILHDQYGNVLQADEKYELAQAFGDEEAVKLIENLYDKIQDVRDGQVQVNEAMQEGMGFVEQMAGHMNKGVLEKVEILKQSWGNLLDKMGEEMSPGVIAGLDTLQNTLLELQGSADFEAIGAQVGELISKLAELMQVALESGVLEDILSVLAEHLDEIIELAAKGAGAWVAFQMAGKAISGAFEIFSTVGEAAESLHEITDVIDLLTHSGGGATGSLAALGTMISNLWHTVSGIFAALPPQAKIVIAIIAAIIAIVGALIYIVHKLGLSWDDVSRIILNAADKAKLAVLGFCDGAVKALENLLAKIPIVGDALSGMAADVSAKIEAAQQSTQDAIDRRNRGKKGTASTDKPSILPNPMQLTMDAAVKSVKDAKKKESMPTTVNETPNLLMSGGKKKTGGGSGKKWTIQDDISKIEDKYEPELELYESRANLAEKQNDYKGEKTNRQSMIDVLNQQVKELLGLESNSTGKNRMTVEAARNKLLLKIAEITEDIRGGVNSMVGEFNKPAGTDALTYYDYMISNAAPGTTNSAIYGNKNNVQIYMNLPDWADMSIDRTKRKVWDLLEALLAGFMSKEEFLHEVADGALGQVLNN